MEPPGTGTLAEQLRAIQKQVTEQGRSKDVRPVAQVYLTGNTDIPNGTDTYAGTEWSVRRDNTGMVHIGTRSYIEIVVAGWYQLHFHACFAPAGTTSAIKITRTPVEDSLATDSADAPTYGGDGTVLDAFRPHVYLPSGDRLYWLTWSSNVATVRSTRWGVPTEVCVQYLHS